MCPRIITTLPGSLMAVVASDILPILQVEGRGETPKAHDRHSVSSGNVRLFSRNFPHNFTRAYTDRGMCCHAPATLCSPTKGSKQHFTESTNILLKPHTESY